MIPTLENSKLARTVDAKKISAIEAILMDLCPNKWRELVSN